LDQRGLVAMPPQAPDENPEAIEIVRPVRAVDRSPQPYILDTIFFLHFSQREIRGDAMPLGILRYLIGDRHV